MTVRVIPRLDIKGPNLVKGIHLEGLRVLGKPEQFARYYYEQGADELIYLDVVASLYGRNSLLDIISRTSREIFIPLTVGGGIRSIEDIREVLRAGADKVSLNTAAIQNPNLIKSAAERFGSSTIVVSIEAIRHSDGHYEAHIDNGRQHTNVDAVDWAQKVAELGAGEILLTSIDREGTGSGYDVELTQKIATQVGIPVIACGGAGSLVNVSEVVLNGKADAVSMASVLHYHYLQVHESDGGVGEGRFVQEGNVEFLKKRRENSRIQTCSLPEIKFHLLECDIPCRPPVGSGVPQ